MIYANGMTRNPFMLEATTTVQSFANQVFQIQNDPLIYSMEIDQLTILLIEDPSSPGGSIIHTRGNVNPGIGAAVTKDAYPFLTNFTKLPPMVGALAVGGDVISIYRQDIRSFRFALVDATKPVWLWIEPRYQ